MAQPAARAARAVGVTMLDVAVAAMLVNMLVGRLKRGSGGRGHEVGTVLKCAEVRWLCVRKREPKRV